MASLLSLALMYGPAISTFVNTWMSPQDSKIASETYGALWKKRLNSLVWYAVTTMTGVDVESTDRSIFDLKVFTSQFRSGLSAGTLQPRLMIGAASVTAWYILTKIFGKSAGQRVWNNLYKKPVTKLQRRNSDGKLRIPRGQFPFPRFLYNQLKAAQPLTDTVVDDAITQMEGSQASDKLLFKFAYVPINLRKRAQDFSEKDLKAYREVLGEKMDYSGEKIDKIVRRVSEYDILRALKSGNNRILEAAVKHHGAFNDPSWATEYMKLRGIAKL